MTIRQSFLTIIVIVQNRAPHLETDLHAVLAACQGRTSEVQVLVVDNGSQDDSVSVLKRLTQPGRLPNVQVLALGASVDLDVAAWVGLDRAIGDYVVVADPSSDDLEALPTLLDAAAPESDLVFAHAAARPGGGSAQRVLTWAFYRLYHWSAGVDLTRAPRYRLLSRRAVNYLHQHPNPAAAYRHLPNSAGLIRQHLTLPPSPGLRAQRPLREDISRGWTMLMSSARGPMRAVSTLSLFGAAANLVYSVYVILIALFKAQVAPGWVTLSLQVSGMFLLISLTLLILGEYVLHITRMATQGPGYAVAQEFASAEFSRQATLNIQTETHAHDTRSA